MTEDTNTDRYPDINEVLRAISQHDDFPTGPVERIEINTFANGDATWRVFEPRSEEPVGGFYTSAQT